MGGVGCFRIYPRVAYDASGLGSCDSRHRLLFEWPIIFWTPCDVQSPRPPTTALSKKLHSLPSSIRRIIQTRGHSCVDPGPSRRAANSVMRKNRRTKPSRQRTYIRLRARVDRLEDAISHFYNVINELRRRVSTLEKKTKPLAKND